MPVSDFAVTEFWLNEVARGSTIGSAIAIGIVYTARTVWRRISRDRVEVATDRAEENFLRRLEREAQLMRERADQAYQERNQAYQDRNDALRAAAECATEVRLLRQRVEELNTEVHSLRDELRRERGRSSPPGYDEGG